MCHYWSAEQRNFFRFSLRPLIVSMIILMTSCGLLRDIFYFFDFSYFINFLFLLLFLLYLLILLLLFFTSISSSLQSLEHSWFPFVGAYLRSFSGHFFLSIYLIEVFYLIHRAIIHLRWSCRILTVIEIVSH